MRKKKMKLSGSIGESTDSETNLGDKIENKNIGFEEVNEIKNEEKIIEKKKDIFNQTEIQIHNNDDY